jgi:hypothetical protein
VISESGRTRVTVEVGARLASGGQLVDSCGACTDGERDMRPAATACASAPQLQERDVVQLYHLGTSR